MVMLRYEVLHIFFILAADDLVFRVYFSFFVSAKKKQKLFMHIVFFVFMNLRQFPPKIKIAKLPVLASPPESRPGGPTR
jgi:hypothetical protein